MKIGATITRPNEEMCPEGDRSEWIECYPTTAEDIKALANLQARDKTYRETMGQGSKEQTPIMVRTEAFYGANLGLLREIGAQ